MSPSDASSGREPQFAASELEALAARFRAPLLAYFEKRARTPEDAEELTQEVFVRLLRRRDLDAIENVEVFIFVTAANLLKDHYRARSRRRDVHSLHGREFVSPEQSPAQQAEDRANIGVLLRAIETLPTKCRAVFVMHRFDEVPHSEIARRLGVTVSMVEKHIAAAMKQLRKTLKDGGHD